MKLQAIFRNGAFRLGVWAAFIILAAALARLANLETAWIIGVIAIAWVLVAVMERSLQRAAAAQGDPSAAAPAAEPAAPVASARTAPERAPAAPKPAPRDPSTPDPDDWLAGAPGAPPAVRAPAPARAAAAPAPIVTIPAAPRSGDAAAAGSVQPPGERPANRPAETAVAPAATLRAPAAAIAPLEPAVVQPLPMLSPLPRRGPAAGQGSWSLWELERLAREAAGTDRARDEERSLILMYLREFANSEGTLGHEFDDLVRESFGDLLSLR